jgi:hypothetical protein
MMGGIVFAGKTMKMTNAVFKSVMIMTMFWVLELKNNAQKLRINSFVDRNIVLVLVKVVKCMCAR